MEKISDYVGLTSQLQTFIQRNSMAKPVPVQDP